MKVREACPHDNAALIALAAQCPMNGELSLCVERCPDFFALNGIAGNPWRAGVIDGDDGPVACIGVARREVYRNGVPTNLAYVGDLKVHPAHRRHGHGRATPADTPAMTKLWQSLAPARQFAPLYPTVQSPGLDYLLAHDPDGELAGFLGLWDQHALKQMRVISYSRRLAVARILLVRGMPAPGGELSYRTAASPCAPDPQTLRTLLLHACRYLHEPSATMGA